MAIRKYLFLLLIISLLLFVGACTKKGTESPGKQNASGIMHGSASKAKVGFIAVIKDQKLLNFDSTTIGNAFDSYRHLTKKEWKEEQLKSGQSIVDFSGWFEPSSLNDKAVKAGVIARGLDIKFVVEPNGSYYVFMISKIESKSDGKIYGEELKDIAGILSKIYANKEISF